MRLALDTNAYADWLKGLHWKDEINQASEVYISTVVLGELAYGFACGSIEKDNLRFLETVLASDRVKVCEVTQETGKYFAILKRHLRINGTPIPDNDIWIAASSLEHQTTLLTRDKHFDQLPQLSVMFGK